MPPSGGYATQVLFNDGLRVNNPWGGVEWAIDTRPLRAKGLIVLVSPN